MVSRASDVNAEKSRSPPSEASSGITSTQLSFSQFKQLLLQLHDFHTHNTYIQLSRTKFNQVYSTSAANSLEYRSRQHHHNHVLKRNTNNDDRANHTNNNTHNNTHNNNTTTPPIRPNLRHPPTPPRPPLPPRTLLERLHPRHLDRPTARQLHPRTRNFRFRITNLHSTTAGIQGRSCSGAVSEKQDQKGVGRVGWIGRYAEGC